MITGKIALLYANEIEGSVIKQSFEKVLPVDKGTYSAGRFILLKTGVGKKNVKKALTKLFNLYPVRAAFSIGSAGALNKEFNAGDIFAPEKIINISGDKIQEEFEYHSDSYDNIKLKLKENGLKVKTGTLISVDEPLLLKIEKKQHHEKFNADACDMETATIAEYSGTNAVPFYCFRVISDSCNQNLPPLEIILLPKKSSFTKKAGKILKLINPITLYRYINYKFSFNKSQKSLKALISTLKKLTR
jgi:adenosylhomocysteine nucleosidase